MLIGSGPLHVIEAAYLQRQGYSVLILERDLPPFGAWKTIPHPMFGQVEMGCHIMERYAGVYDFLHDFLGLDMKPMAPNPVVIRHGRKIPYDWKWNQYIVQSLIKRGKLLRFGHFVREVRSNYWRFHLHSKVYLYPKGGSAEFGQSLNNLVEKEQLPIKTNCLATSLTQRTQHWDIDTSQGIIRAKKIYLSSLSDIESVKTEKRVITPEYRAAGYHHYHFLTNIEERNPFEYLRVMSNPTIHRISNITNQLPIKLPDNQHLILIGVFNAAFSNITNEQVFDETAKILRDAGYINTMQLMDTQVNSYHCKYLTKDSIAAMQTFKGIHHLASTNLTLSFKHRLKDWRSTFGC